MKEKTLLKLRGDIAPLSSSEANLLLGGFGTIGTIAIQPLANYSTCGEINKNCSGGDVGTNDNCVVANSNCVCTSCSTSEPTTDEPTDEPTDDTTDDLIPTDDD